MPNSSRRLLAAPLVLGALAVPGHADAARVKFRVEGTNRTLVPETTITTEKRSVSRGGQTSCAGSSGLGALDVATRGSWDGSYNSQYKDYLISEIDRERHPGAPTYWSVFLDHKFAPTGLCGLTPKNGDSILLYPDSGAGTHYPLGLTAPTKARAGRAFRVRVLVYRGADNGKPVSGATVAGGGVKAKTNAQGYARITRKKAGRVVLKASKTGLTRSETDAVRITR